MWQPSRLTADQMEERRLEGGRLLRAGELSQAEIARRLGVSRMTVSDWAKALRQGGPAALRRRPKTGRPPRRPPEQWRLAREALGEGAIAAGYETERWTLDRIRALIRKLFGVAYHAHYLSERLKALGWSAQVPTPRAAQRDEERIRRWRERDWPRIKKRPGAGGPRSSSSTRRASASATGPRRRGPRGAARRCSGARTGGGSSRRRWA